MDTTDKGGTASGGLCTILMMLLNKISVDGAAETVVYAVLGTMVGFVTTKALKHLSKKIEQLWLSYKK